MKYHFVLGPNLESREPIVAAARRLPIGYHCIFSNEEARTLEQNSYQWPYLEGFAKQKEWSVNNEMTLMTKEEWKDVLTAAFYKETNLRLAAGMDGGVVMLGMRTSGMSKRVFSEWMQFLIATADIYGIAPVFRNGRYKKWQPE